ncbi:glutamate receptor 3.2 [Beta vulgaris subsp. vulgaris]|uniref:glutamate receptor 3.2 n=1 Tax=Beta vulgaris subsp. vulgaris TaxID=3555 RepID=UPI0020367068|nr:glutamate receptor 3.2 [Beta vulgaris subsp. vulgaris]XP_048491816.1 glutamate receptor 3.2 [Beta vulgaris subsp. vulgaris]XP_057247689.1 glutamate receptor 3.2 [Beta vulgaris subsp. vulgaris]
MSNFTMKLVHILPWLVVLCIMMFLEDTSGSDKVNIGAIFTLGTINGKVSQIAMNAAVDDINSDPSILSGRTLFLDIHDSNYNGFLSIMGALQFMETDTVAIIGPQSSIMAHVLSHLANQLHVPLLSFTALDPTLSPIQYPYFFQTAPNDLFQMAAIAEMVSYYRWTQVIAIFTDEEQSRNGITALGDKLTERRAKISYKAVLPPDIRGQLSVVKQELAKVKMMESRVLVVHTLSAYGKIILEAAEELGMIGDGYVWIATAWLPAVLDSKQNPETYKRTQGVITLRPHTPDSPRKKAFIARWNNLSKGSTGLTVYGLYAYDTVWLIARAIDAFLRQGNNISFSNDPVLTSVGGGNMNLSALSIFDGGSELLKLILETNMTGLTGPIWYNPDRVLVNPSFDVINIVGSQMRQIGYWSNYSGLSVLPPEILRERPQNRSMASQKLSSVVWPGGTNQIPRGWVFPRDGRKLRIGIPRRVSFLKFVYQDNQTHAIGGYCIDVFKAAVKLLPYAVSYEFIFFGDGHQNPNYNDLMKRITTGEFEAAVGDIAIVTNRTMIVDFTQPYADSGLVVVAPVKKLSSNSWAFLRPFTGLMWAVTGVFFLVVGAVIWILEHRLNDEFRGPPSKQLMTILWFSFSTLFFAHRENTVSTLGRMVLVIWLFVVLIIQSSYTASLTSFLTVQQLSFSIKGIDSLITSNAPIGFQVGSYAENYLNEELNIHRSRLKPLNSPEDYADALKSGRVAAVVDEQPYVDLFLSNYCQFAISGPQFTKSGWGFAFKRDSPLALDMSTALLELSENGSLQNITEFWLKKKQGCQSQLSVNDSEQLKLDNFVGLFLICGVACILALIIYFCLMLYQFHGHLPQQSEASSHGSTRSARLRTFFSFADKKEDLSQRRLKRKRMPASMPTYGNEMMEIEPGENTSKGQDFDRYRGNNRNGNGTIWNP